MTQIVNELAELLRANAFTFKLEIGALINVHAYRSDRPPLIIKVELSKRRNIFPFANMRQRYAIAQVDFMQAAVGISGNIVRSAETLYSVTGMHEFFNVPAH